MALPVLDGNQSATTLSSVVTGGEHIVAHSVVSLGATAISNINSAVSGTAVTIPGLARLGSSIASDNTADANLDFIKIGGHQDGQNQVAHIVHVSAGGAMKVDASGSSVTFSQAPVTFGAITGSASILNFPSTQTIAGTVTANVGPDIVGDRGGGIVPSNALAIGHEVVGDGFYNVSTDKPLPISGAVTANVAEPAPGVNTFISESGSFSPVYAVGIGYNTANNAEFLAVNDSGNNFPVAVNNSVTIGSLPAISGTVTANAILQNANAMAQAFIDESDGYGAVGVSIVNAAQSLSVFGAVTANASNGSLTTRFGTPTTANTAFATSAVTNASRKYLLIQNVTTGSNVITVGIGFTPTTTQGIQLTAGAGITFESSYIPTGAVYVLSSVTASNFTILEA